MAQTPGNIRLFSVRHEFPAEWAKFTSSDSVNDQYPLTLELKPEHYPFWCQGKLNKIERFDVLARSTEASLKIFNKEGQEIGKLTKDQSLGDILHAHLTTGSPKEPIGLVNLLFNSKQMSDLWIAIRFKVV